MRESRRALRNAARSENASRVKTPRIVFTAVAITIALVVSVQAGTAQLNRVAEQTTPQRLAIIGDSLAQDLWNGMHKLYRGHDKVEFIRFTKVSSGLVRDDVYNWNTKVKAFVAEHEYDTAIVLIGGNDRQSITIGSKRLDRFGKAWTEEYGRRVDDLIATLKSKGGAVYWLGLPIVRSKRMANDYRKLNKVYKERAEANDITYIDTWPLFETEDGKYTSFGLDLKGTKRRLRKDDGLHFTVAGKLVFAREIARLLRKKVSRLQSETPVPLFSANPGG